MSERHGHGIFDCPNDDCHVTIVGSYGDLLDHVRDEHPLSKIIVDSRKNTVLDRIKWAQQAALKQDVREQMYGDEQGESA